MDHRAKQKGFSVVEVLLVVAVVAVLGVLGFAVYQHNRPQTSGATGGTTINQNATQSTTTTPVTIKTYSSGKEHASFTYPSNWVIAKNSISSSDASNADHVALVSPSGVITISYVTDLVGFGNEHTASYPYNTVVDKTAITGASGLYVVSGITTLDGTTYYPWIAVQDNNGILTSGVQGDLATFAAFHALNPSTNSFTSNLFSTSGARTTQSSPALTQAQALAWFSGLEAQQAKQILLSFIDTH